jgi:hypothetical protein
LECLYPCYLDNIRRRSQKLRLPQRHVRIHHAALRNFETYGQAATADIQRTQQLLAEIEQAIGKQ